MVALDPRTGAVKVMASTPGYDPNCAALAARHMQRLDGATRPAKPLVNRATQFGYAPGSTFKVVTATAAIDTGRLHARIDVERARPRARSPGSRCRTTTTRASAQITLTQALAKSVNTVWAQVAERLGKRTMARYMDRFGFDRKPQLDYPAEQMSASGEYLGSRLISPTSPQVDVGRMGIGQDKLEVVPLQMAEVAAAVANHGRLMVPHLTERIVEADGRTVERVSPRVQSVVMKPSTADAVTSMMEAVVKRRHRHRGPDPGRPGGGQDGYGRDADRDGDQQRLVHRLRAGGRSDGGDRGDPPGSARAGRRVCGAGRPAGDGKPVAMIEAETIIDGRYRVLSRLGSGGMAEVYLAEDQLLGQAGRGEGAAPALRRRPGVRRALPPRGLERGGAVAPEHRRRSSTAASGTAPTTSRWSTWPDAR